MKKITILALHLGYGGIEKTIVSVANMLSSNYEVEIISTYQIYEKPSFELNDKVHVTYLLPNEKPNKKEFMEALKTHKVRIALKEGRKAIRLLVLKKRRMIQAIKNCKSDVIISTREIHNLWLGKYGNKSSLKIGWEHNYHDNNQKRIKKIVRSIQKLDKFVLVSEELKDFYEKLAPSTCQCVYIPNSLSNWPKESSTLTNKKMISVGRLEPEKGFSDLIDVFYLFQKEEPDWTLDIIGDGFQRENIEKQIHDYHLEDKIVLHGMQNAEYVAKYLKDASIYVLPSFSESFGIVILEAYSYALPVVAFDSASGARALIQNGKTGFLISNRDKEEMKKSLLQLSHSKELRTKLGKNGKEEAKHYLEPNIKTKWIHLIEEGK